MRDIGPAAGGRAAVYAPLQVGRRADAVVRRLADGINLGLLAPDEQLPSESDLADALGVSPVTVREALTALRGAGLLVTRRGRNGGSFVREGAARPADDARALRELLRATSPFDLRDLADHAVALSGTCAALAAERAGGQDVALIADSVRALERATDPGARRRAESRFHVELAAAAQSARLTRAVIALQAEIGPLLWPSDGGAEVVRRHREILDAVVAGDSAAARGRTVAHLYAALAHASALQLTFLAEHPPVVGDPLDAVVERVTAVCESAFAAVDGLRGAVEQMLAEGDLRAGAGEPVARLVRPLLATGGTPLVGAGLVLAPGVLADGVVADRVLADTGHRMEWWHRTPGGTGVERLDPELDAAAPGFYDYTVLPWFAVPRETGARHVTGPYVDHLCTQEYTLTFTAPLMIGGFCAGVVGADIVTSWVERTLLPLLGAIGRPTALVNAQGRVAVANDPSLVVGSVVPEGAGRRRVLAHLPLAVLVM